MLINKDNDNLMKLVDENGNVFAYFSRYKNKEISFADNAKVFDANKKVWNWVSDNTVVVVLGDYIDSYRPSNQTRKPF